MVNYITPVERRLTGFRKYIENTEQVFQQRRIDLDGLIQASEETCDPTEWWADDYWLHTEMNLMRMSLFLSLYAFLELIMGELCYLQQIEHEFTLKPDDLTRRQGKIDQYKNYLMKVVGIDFTFGGKEWSEIKKYQKLRNHFAHEGLRLTVKNYKKLTPVIQHHPELHHNLFSKSTSGFTLNMTAEELEELKKFGENKAQQRFAILYDEGFLGHNNQGMDMYGDDIEIKAGFCGAVVETIDSFWTQLIESVQRTHSSAH